MNFRPENDKGQKPTLNLEGGSFNVFKVPDFYIRFIDLKIVFTTKSLTANYISFISANSMKSIEFIVKKK